MAAIVIATSHRRYDSLEKRLRERLPELAVIRIREREELTERALEQINPKYVVFPHWSWLIPASVYRRFECIVFHMTDLPYGRGGSPLQNLIVRGHGETKLTALKCEAELDSGPVYLKRALVLDGSAEEIFGRAALLMEDMIVEIVHARPVPRPQEGEVTKFERRRPCDGNLAVVRDSREAYDFIRMLDADGYPPAFLRIGHLYIEFRCAKLDGGVLEARVRVKGAANE